MGQEFSSLISIYICISLYIYIYISIFFYPYIGTYYFWQRGRGRRACLPFMPCSMILIMYYIYIQLLYVHIPNLYIRYLDGWFSELMWGFGDNVLTLAFLSIGYICVYIYTYIHIYKYPYTNIHVYNIVFLTPIRWVLIAYWN